MTQPKRMDRDGWAAVDVRDAKARQALLAYAVHVAVAGPGWHRREDTAIYVAEAARIARAGTGDAGPAAPVLAALEAFLASSGGAQDRDMSWSHLRLTVERYFLARFAQHAAEWAPEDATVREASEHLQTRSVS